MCILRDGSMCPRLSREEERAQHNFEERKGPYPKALADRLHNEGIMAREVHFGESLMRRRENVEKQIFYDNFTPSMDCSREEKDFMLGNRHDLPMDIFLPTNLGDEMLRRFTRVRKQYFRIHLHGFRELKAPEFLFDYPEFDNWFAEFSSGLRAYSRNLRLLADGLLDRPGLMEKLAGIVSEPTLRVLVTRLFYRLFQRGTVSKDGRFVDAISKAVPEQHRQRFQQVQYSWRLITGDKKNISSNRIRRQRKILNRKLLQWSRVLQDDKLIVRNCVENLMIHILSARSSALSG